MKLSPILCSALAVVVLALNASLANAQETASPEKAALIKQIAEMTGGKEQFNQMMTASIESEREEFKQAFTTLVKDNKHSTPYMNDPTLMKLVDESMDRVGARSQEFFTKRFNYDKFVDDVFVPVYAKHFTDDELRDLVAFYASPTGRKMVHETPQMMKETMATTFKTLLPEFNEFMSHVVDDEMTTIKKSLPRTTETISTVRDLYGKKEVRKRLFFVFVLAGALFAVGGVAARLFDIRGESGRNLRFFSGSF